MRKWGLYYDDLVQMKPDIIAVSASQQGHTGPHADYLGFGYLCRRYRASIISPAPPTATR